MTIYDDGVRLFFLRSEDAALSSSSVAKDLFLWVQYFMLHATGISFIFSQQNARAAKTQNSFIFMDADASDSAERDQCFSLDIFLVRIRIL